MTMYSMMELNVFRKNKNIAKAREEVGHLGKHWGVTAIFAQEAYDLGRVDGFRRYGDEDSDWQKEVAVYLPSDIEAGISGTYRMSHSAGRAVNHARYGTHVRTREGAPLSFLSTHMNADIKDGDVTKVHEAGTKEWVGHMKEILAWCKKEKRAGRIPNVGMDSNWSYPKDRVSRRERLKMWWWAPERAFRRHGMQWVNQGMMGIAVPKKARVKKHVLASWLIGSDHPIIVVDVTL